MKKNVWIINHYAGIPNIASGARHFNLAKQLVKKGYDVTIFLSSAMHNVDYNSITDGSLYVEDMFDGVRFVSVRTMSYSGNNHRRIINILQFWSRVKKVAKIIGKYNSPDVVIGSSMHPLTLYAGAKIAKHFNCKYIEEIRDLWPETFLSLRPNFNKSLLKFFYNKERNLYRKADKLIFTFEGCYEYIVERGWQGDFVEDDVYYINNGIDLESYRDNLDNCRIDDVDLDDERSFKAVYTGTIGLVNDIDMLVKAAEILKDRGYDDIKILVWGNGPELGRLEAEVSERGLDNIVFKHHVEKKYVPYILSKSDVSLLHNKELPVHRFGTSQNKKFDYLAAGRPVISTAKSGYDVIKENSAGVTLDSPTAENLVEGILYFYDLPKDEYAEYCANALELAAGYDFAVLSDILVVAIEK